MVVVRDGNGYIPIGFSYLIFILMMSKYFHLNIHGFFFPRVDGYGWVKNRPIPTYPMGKSFHPLVDQWV